MRVSGLDWTILRPGRLTDDERTLRRQWNLVGGDVPIAEAIARTD